MPRHARTEATARTGGVAMKARCRLPDYHGQDEGDPKRYCLFGCGKWSGRAHRGSETAVQLWRKLQNAFRDCVWGRLLSMKD